MSLRTIFFVFVGVFAMTLATMQMVNGVEKPTISPTVTDAQPTKPLQNAMVVTPPPPPQQGGSTSTIRRDDDGHFRAQAQVNGQQVEVMVDSGATLVALPESVARRLGIAPDPSQYIGRARTANGEVAFAPVKIDSIRIGAVERRDIAGAVMRDTSLPAPLLGQSFLGALNEMNIRGDIMTIH